MTKFTIYDNEISVEVDITEEKKDKTVERILLFCKENNCVDGETLHQSDDCLIDAPNVLSDIIEIFNFKSPLDD